MIWSQNDIISQSKSQSAGFGVGAMRKARYVFFFIRLCDGLGRLQQAAVPDGAEHGHRYGSFATPEALLRSVNLAFALDALNLMYDINSYFKKP